MITDTLNDDRVELLGVKEVPICYGAPKTRTGDVLQEVNYKRILLGVLNSLLSI